ncbi:MAG TPA: hypothetical protein VFK04_20510 [Gemmatimonadaceae bacterium]|jgi:hypothetical protein|nr:hypothetical protein [Gemmatimonadaceae bacterium]
MILLMLGSIAAGVAIGVFISRHLANDLERVHDRAEHLHTRAIATTASSFDRTLGTLREVTGETDLVIYAVRAGRPRDRGDSAKFAADWRQLVPSPTSSSPEEPMSFSDEADERTLSQF